MPSDDLNYIPGHHMTARENRLHHTEVMVLISTDVHYTHTQLCKIKKINKIKQQKRNTLNKKEHFGFFVVVVFQEKVTF